MFGLRERVSFNGQQSLNRSSNMFHKVFQKATTVKVATENELSFKGIGKERIRRRKVLNAEAKLLRRSVY